MKKQEMRDTILHKLKNITDEERKQMEDQMYHHLIDSNLWKKANTIGITMSKGVEWDTSRIIETGWEQNKQMCVPKCIPKEKKLVFYRLETFDQLEIVYANLLEPKPEKSKEIEKNDIDLLIVPGLLFDDDGYRIGFGGGYYDRFLEDFYQEKASLCSSLQLVDEVPKKPYDLPVDYLITEEEIKDVNDHKHT